MPTQFHRAHKCTSALLVELWKVTNFIKSISFEVQNPCKCSINFTYLEESETIVLCADTKLTKDGGFTEIKSLWIAATDLHVKSVPQKVPVLF